MLHINNTPVSRDSFYRAQESIGDIHPGLARGIIIDTSAPYRDELQDSVSKELRQYVSWAVTSIRHADGKREIIGIHTMNHPIIIVKLLIFLEQLPLLSSDELHEAMQRLGATLRANY